MICMRVSDMLDTYRGIKAKEYTQGDTTDLDYWNPGKVQPKTTPGPRSLF